MMVFGKRIWESQKSQQYIISLKNKNTSQTFKDWESFELKSRAARKELT